MKCRILKLKSGEDVISTVCFKLKTKYTLIDPYIFKSTTMVNFDSGLPYDVTTIKDWLMLTHIKTIVIPSSHVAGMSIPSKEAKNLYMKELKKVKELTKPKPTKSKEEPPTSEEDLKEKKLNPKDFEKEMMGIMDKIMGNMMPNPGDLHDDFFPDPKDKMFDRPMIQMSMIFPPEVIIELMESGIINVNDVKKIAKEVKKKLRFTGDEKHRPDFGNKLTDWNPDPKSDDYTK